MTAPGFDITTIIPLKYKSWVAAIGGLLATLVPIVLGLLDLVPAQYAYIATGVHALIWVLQWAGVYKAKYVPDTAVLAPDTPAVQAAANQPLPTTGHPHQNPWE